MKSLLIFFIGFISISLNGQELDTLKHLSSDDGKIYATKFGHDIYLDDPLHVKVKKRANQVIYMLESNDDGQVTRQLNRLSDTTFLYTEYYALSYDQFVRNHGNYGIKKEGVLVVSDETVIDSTEMWDYETYELLPSPRKRKVLKPTGTWKENYNVKHVKVKGSYNEYGKHGEWHYYNPQVLKVKTLTYDNGQLTKKEFINELLYESIERTRAIIQKKWAVSTMPNTLHSKISKYSSTYDFQKDGTFIYNLKKYEDGGKIPETRKGSWRIVDHKTIEYTIKNKKKRLDLRYMSDKKILF